MKIGLNAIDFRPGSMGGVETYFRNLVDQLQRLDMKNRYTLIGHRASAREFRITNPNFSTEAVGYEPSTLRFIVRGTLRNTVGIDPLRSRFHRLKLDVVHHPFSSASPVGLKTSTVLTFWDMQQEYFPEFFSPLQLWIRRRMYPASAREATRIIVNAHFTKGCLIERYGIPEGKIDVIYTGIGPGYRVVSDAAGLEAVRRKYRLEKPFLYYPAAAWPHKNHAALLSALRLLKETRGFDGELVLTGVQHQSQGNLLPLARDLGIADSVKSLGYLPYEELPSLYNLARLLVFPSLFEGFGIPLVEAMACGCPVVCSGTTSLPEVIGDAGITFDPKSPEDIAEKIWSAWSSEGTRDLLRMRGLERARTFDWTETARKTVAVYECAAGAGK